MIDDLNLTSEEEAEIKAGLASADFNQPDSRPPIKPGWYLSPSRTLTDATSSKGNRYLKVKFAPFTTLEGQPVRDFPPFENLTFYKEKVWGGEGEISRVGAYLKACNLPFMGLDKDELIEALNESETTPVKVYVGWEQDYREVNKAEKERPKKTAFFKTGENGQTRYIHERIVDGRKYTARAKIVKYEKA